MPDESDRRHARRFIMTLPLRVLRRGVHHSELHAQTRDISYRGLYFLTDTRFEPNREIEFVITLPRQVAQSSDVDIHCHGQVLRVESGPNGQIGVAARIERYEFMPVSGASAA
jgi:hypothetical protein